MKDFLSKFLKPGSSPRFALGRVVATPGALALMHVTNSNPFVLLAKHVTGDWGEIDPEDVQTNEDAVAHGLRVLSVYRLPLQHTPEEGHKAAQSAPRLDVDDNRIWLITEADRSVTTLLLPEEYDERPTTKSKVNDA
ncbi:type I restriction endonuclease subunit M [Variovorax sp. LT1R20]|uniref:type I restriction endonuclease subunit M n=1 Tax=Variovorax sp. LT1R20 TaxID=3443729 RepID=UPI003F48E0AB